MARGAMAANVEEDVLGAALRPGRTVVLVEPANQLAMVARIRLLEGQLRIATNVLESTSDAAQRKHVARQLRIESEI